MSIIEKCYTDLKQEREDVDNFSQRIIQHCLKLAQESNITVSMPRTNQRQQHRSNIQSSSVEEYFKQSILIPFLDHLISDISSRFSKHTKQRAALQGILHSNITPTSSFDDIEPAVTFYSDDLPNVSILDEELHRWKSRWLQILPDDRPEVNL